MYEIQHEELEKRILFDIDVRKEVLAKSHGKCACCNTQLNTKTMTIDHIIPISRGGSNNKENLIGLCKTCNELKSNMLYRPEGFYISMINDPLYKTMQDLFREWFDGIYKDFDIELFPLISPQHISLFSPIPLNNRKKFPISSQFMIKWDFMGNEYIDMMQGITGLNMTELRCDTNMIHYGKYEKHSVAVYALTKVNSDKWLSVVSVLYDKETKQLTVYEPWCNMTKSNEACTLFHFVYYLFESLVKYAHEDILSIQIATHNASALKDFYTRETVLPLFCLGVSSLVETDIEGIKDKVYVSTVIRELPEVGPIVDRYGHAVVNFETHEQHAAMKARNDMFRKVVAEEKALADERYDKAHKQRNIIKQIKEEQSKEEQSKEDNSIEKALEKYYRDVNKKGSKEDDWGKFNKKHKKIHKRRRCNDD